MAIRGISQLEAVKAMKKYFKKTARPSLKQTILTHRQFLKEAEEKGIGVYEDSFGTEWAECLKQYDIYSLNLLSHVYNKNLEKALKYEKKIMAMAKKDRESENYDYYSDAAEEAVCDTLQAAAGAIQTLRETLEAEKVIKQHKEAAAKKAAKGKGKGKKGRGKK